MTSQDKQAREAAAPNWRQIRALANLIHSNAGKKSFVNDCALDIITALDPAIEAAALSQGMRQAEGAMPDFAVVPLRMNQAMREVVDTEGWQWEDLLAAAEAITEEQYNDLAASAPAQPASPIHEQKGVEPAEEVTREMIAAGARAAREYYEKTGGNDPAVIYRAMRALAKRDAQGQAAQTVEAEGLTNVIEKLAQQWDGCEYDTAAVGLVDIGDAIRRAGFPMMLAAIAAAHPVAAHEQDELPAGPAAVASAR